MATYNKQLQELFDQYAAAGNHPASIEDACNWAFRQGLWKPRPADMVAKLREDMGRALREEYRIDDKGRRYRAKHCIRERQQFFWDDMDSAARGHMEKAFALRRKLIRGDCHQLKTDVDHYNDYHPDEEPIQMILDFTEDVEEMEVAENRVAS